LSKLTTQDHGTRTCAAPDCSNQFVATTNTQRYCSDECARRTRFGLRTCQQGGKEFIPSLARQRFCDRTPRLAVANNFGSRGKRAPSWNEVSIMRLPHPSLAAWGFKRDPFADEPVDETELFWSRAHENVRARITNAIERNEMIALSAPVGWGKTFLWIHIQQLLEADDRTGYSIARVRAIRRELITANTVLEAIYRDIEGEEPPNLWNEAFSRRVEQLLLARARSARRIVVVIDEAHRIDDSALKSLKIIRDIRHGFRPCIGVVLLGQEELAAQMRSHFKREVGARTELIAPDPLIAGPPDDEVRRYITWRCAIAVRDRAPLTDELAEYTAPFTDEAWTAIDDEFRREGGTPATFLSIGAVASHALYECWANGEEIVNEVHVRTARAKVQEGVF